MIMLGRRARCGAGGGLAAGAVLAAMLSACAGGNRPLPPAPIAAAPACADVSFPVYFSQDSDQLTDPARQALGLAATAVHGCRIGFVSVIGLTDDVGGSSDNLALSKRRAATVASALQAAGLPAPKFEVRGLGETGAVTRRGRAVPLRRRTDVVIHVVTG